MNQAILLSETIKYLLPNAEFVIRGDDLNGLEWLSVDVAQPSNTEILNAVADYQNYVIEQKAAKEAKRAAAISKLEALGLDEDDLKALGF